MPRTAVNRQSLDRNLKELLFKTENFVENFTLSTTYDKSNNSSMDKYAADAFKLLQMHIKLASENKVRHVTLLFVPISKQQGLQ